MKTDSKFRIGPTTYCIVSLVSTSRFRWAGQLLRNVVRHGQRGSSAVPLSNKT